MQSVPGSAPHFGGLSAAGRGERIDTKPYAIFPLFSSSCRNICDKWTLIYLVAFPRRGIMEPVFVRPLAAGENRTGPNNVTVRALPHDRLREVLRRYNRVEG